MVPTPPAYPAELAVQDQSDGSVIDEFNLHVGSELTSFDPEVEGTELVDEQVEESLALGVGRRLYETGTTLSRRVSINGEVGDGQHLSTLLRRQGLQTQVHLPFRVIEDTKVLDLEGKLSCVGIGVLHMGSNEKEESRSTLAHNADTDGNGGSANPLYYCPHLRIMCPPD